MSPAPRGRTTRRALVVTAAVAAPAALVAAVLVPTVAFGAVDLPDRTPQELVSFAQASDVRQLTGTLDQESALGLPDLGALGGEQDGDDSSSAGFADLLDLATGSHTARVYVDDDRARLQVLDSLAERNLYLDRTSATAWFVDSESATATRLSLAPGTDLAQLEAEAEQRKADAAAEYEAATGEAVPTPEALLDQALAALDETTEVSVGTDGRVAGRDAYELILTPRADDTLVGEIRVAIDGENGTALAASVNARGADEPAFSVAYTDIDFAAPAASDLVFEPGSGIDVVEKQIDPAAQRRDRSADGAAAPRPEVTGTGWSTVVEIAGPTGGTVDAEQQRTLESLTTAVPGGRVLETALVSVLLTDDGRVLAGAVPANVLAAAAAR